MMSVQRRALLIGISGPALQAVGLLWEAIHLVVSHYHASLSVRHLIFEPAVLVFVVGFLLTLVCVPLALDVARARADETSLPLLDARLRRQAEALETGGEP